MEEKRQGKLMQVSKYAGLLFEGDEEGNWYNAAKGDYEEKLKQYVHNNIKKGDTVELTIIGKNKYTHVKRILDNEIKEETIQDNSNKSDYLEDKKKERELIEKSSYDKKKGIALTAAIETLKLMNITETLKRQGKEIEIDVVYDLANKYLEELGNGKKFK